MKEELLAVILSGYSADTIAVSTTSRPAPPQFDCGDPKDEDNKGASSSSDANAGEDSQEKKPKLLKGASEEAYQEYLQAKVLYDTAGA